MSAVNLWQEYDKLTDKSSSIVALDANHALGDNIDLYTGTLSFSADDIALPGNNQLTVGVTRSYAVIERQNTVANKLPFADWDLDIPRLSGTFAPNWHDNRCDVAAPPPIYLPEAPVLMPSDYWTGNRAIMPGGGVMMIADAALPKPSSGGAFRWVTSGFTYFSCLPNILNGTGQGFLGVTRDGTRYWFTHMAQYNVSELVKRDVLQTSWGFDEREARTIRKNNTLYVSRVEDRFGNWVAYSYSNNSNEPVRITSISSSDGRSISFQYNSNGYISSISDGSRSWLYEYQIYTTSPASNPAKYTLSKVTLPDASRWEINLSGLSKIIEPILSGKQDDDDCFSPALRNSGSYSGAITHPSGVTGTFVVGSALRGRSNVPAMCNNMTVPRTAYSKQFESASIPNKWYAFVLRSKEISGLGVPISRWEYTYVSDGSLVYVGGGTADLPVCTSGASCFDPVCVSDSCSGKNSVSILNPDSTRVRYDFGNSYKYNEGKLLSATVSRGDGSILERTTYSYSYADGQPYVARMGNANQWNGDSFVDEYPRPMTISNTLRDGTNFNWTVNAGCAGPGIRCFDQFARPISVTRSSYPSN